MVVSIQRTYLTEDLIAAWRNIPLILMTFCLVTNCLPLSTRQKIEPVIIEYSSHDMNRIPIITIKVCHKRIVRSKF